MGDEKITEENTTGIAEVIKTEPEPTIEKPNTPGSKVSVRMKILATLSVGETYLMPDKKEVILKQIDEKNGMAMVAPLSKPDKLIPIRPEKLRKKVVETIPVPITG